MMNMFMRAIFAALLLAVAPVSMAFTIPASVTVDIGGAPADFAGQVDPVGYADLGVEFTGFGIAKSATVVFHQAVTSVSLVKGDTLLKEFDYIGKVIGNGGNEGYGYTLSYFLNPGSYKLHVVGTAGQTFSGSISGSAVPLPGAALLFGSAVVGAGMFRRRKNAAGSEAIAA